MTTSSYINLTSSIRHNRNLMSIEEDKIMYKGKPLIAYNRPWWRSPIFPWGWYSIIQDSMQFTDAIIDSDGSYAPNDGGGGKFRFYRLPSGVYDTDKIYSGFIITPSDSSGSQWIRGDFKISGALPDIEE